MAGYTETERLEEIELELKLEELTKTYCGDPIFLAELKEFLNSLDDIDKMILYLKSKGYSSLEIGEELGYTKRRINQRLKRIRKLLDDWVG
jgi:DNA-directed RNA polymerase specialized sigma24 family protein